MTALRSSSFTSFLFAFICFSFISLAIADTVTIDVPYGTVTGLQLENSLEFLGIPYAQPPLGSLRFRPPELWKTPTINYQQEATAVKSACMQRKSFIYDFPGEPSEDCLYLNVFTPVSKSKPIADMKLPVMFWIHGGAFTGGSGSEPKYNGTVLAATQNVVVVTINYRLGAFGFMADPAFCAESPSCGIWGILDQQIAMTWVQKNIASFGGNPKNVTIFGESAGGMSVLVQLAQANTTGLFQQAIIESGIAEGYPSLETAEGYGSDLAGALGCIGVESCMRSASADEILDAQKKCSEPNCWWPVINGFELQDQPLDYIISGNYNQVPIMMGCNSNEGWLFSLAYFPLLTDRKYERVVMETFGEFGSLVLQEYPADNYDSPFDAMENVLADGLFISQVQYVAEAISNGNTQNPVAFFYLFDHTPSYGTNRAGAFHGSELPFVFGFRDGLKTFTAEEEQLSKNMTSFWGNFAHKGNPNPVNEDSLWPLYNTQTTLRIVLNTGEATYINQLHPQQCEFWKQYYILYYPESLQSVSFPFVSLHVAEEHREIENYLTF